MNMENYDRGIWMLHRKLFHRYMKYYKYFKQATEALPEFQQLLADDDDAEAAEVLKKEAESQSVPKSHIISLLTSSSDEVSPEEDNGDNDSET